MNLAASYGLITIGLADAWPHRLWVGTPAGRVLALWMAGWWFVRAARAARDGPTGRSISW